MQTERSTNLPRDAERRLRGGGRRVEEQTDAPAECFPMHDGAFRRPGPESVILLFGRKGEREDGNQTIGDSAANDRGARAGSVAPGKKMTSAGRPTSRTIRR